MLKHHLMQGELAETWVQVEPRWADRHAISVSSARFFRPQTPGARLLQQRLLHSRAFLPRRRHRRGLCPLWNRRLGHDLQLIAAGI